MVSKAPWRSKSFCAVGRSNNASVAPRRLFEEPKRATPDTVNSPGPVVVTTLIRWPTEIVCSAAVPASITTWSGPTGGAPPDSICSVGIAASHEPPIGGAPPFWITLFVLGSTIQAVPPIDPSAAAPPSTPPPLGPTPPPPPSGSPLGGSGLGSLPPRVFFCPLDSTPVVPCTTTSVPL